ncbi:MAG: 1-(5-phosphoribosyl)-5-[(5-phosphoribosylamino)methylideneamino]imidazole-4-carboxamide isomerase [Candidatus Omnitrophica bacterium]|nr:1-(5-phosphoribosyl)-5-[(5-phosphoribosylamino)methylideneamino]imidazole-4-carboxamide isomerase [Candidatus Omnitrophota bacterium]
MRIIPAIDLRGGKVVRLSQGMADRETVYSDSPVDIAVKWAETGVDMIHIVDLDGAFEGELRNLPVVKDIVRTVKPRIELGGGMRDEASIQMALDAGVDKVVIGTRALDRRFLEKIVVIHGKKIVVGLDARAGMVRTKGWTSETDIKAIELARSIEASGVKTVNYTDISRDGMLEGPNIESLRELLRAVDMDIVAAGGVSTIEDVRNLKGIESEGLSGIIIGKALYEGRIDLREAMAITK